MVTDSDAKPTVSPEILQLHRDLMVVDVLNVSVPNRAQLERMQKAGLTSMGMCVNLFEDFTETARRIAHWERIIDMHSDIVRPVRTVDDIYQAKKENKVGLFYGLQNTLCFEDEFGFIAHFQKLGVRTVQLAYMYQNQIATGCLERFDSGLTSYGVDVVKELNHRGMIVDLSHCAPKTSEEAIEASSLPCIYSHAACLALCSSPRNKSDDQLRHIASKGGMIGLVTYPTFIKDTAPTFADWFAHLDHLVEVVGVDSVGIGTDFIEGQPEGFADRAYFRRPHPPGLVPPGWPWPYPTGVEDVNCYPTITAGLLERGYDRESVRKIMGENWLRLFRQCWEHPTAAGASWRPGIPSPTEAGLYEDGEHE